MAKNTILLCLFTGLIVAIQSTSALAAGCKPLPVIKWSHSIIAVSDSVPGSKNQQENKENNSTKTEESIKEVPKAHKQEKPLAVVTTIKPVIVKPKIIVKPAIKIH